METLDGGEPRWASGFLSTLKSREPASQPWDAYIQALMGEENELSLLKHFTGVLLKAETTSKLNSK